MIGRQVVALLLEGGAEVRVASLDDPGDRALPYEFRQGDLTDGDFCRSVVSGCDIVFHLAGIKGSVGIGRTKGASFMVPLLLMNTQLMEAARRADVQRLVYTSSIAVYHPAEVFIEDRAWDGPPHPSDQFAAWAKRMGELQADAYLAEYGWDRTVIVRPTNVFGPGDNFDPQTAMVIPALIARAVTGENPLEVWGDGSAVRDFLFSRDCAEAMLLAAQHAPGNTPINLGSGRPTSIREVVAAISSCFDPPPQITWDTERPAGNNVRVMDTTRARELIGFEARTPLDTAIRETVEWYLAHRAEPDGRYDPFQVPTTIQGRS